MNPNRFLPVALLLASCGSATQPAANQTPTPASSWTGLTRSMEVIHARAEVMEHMELLMESIDTIQVEPVRNVDELHMHAETIAAMLQAVPHLFPPTTNIYNPNGPDFPTLALPAIWDNFDTFYGLAMAASAAAGEMADAKVDATLRAASLKLRNSCDACHKLFLRKYVPSTPQESDYKFDFDAALDIKKK